MSFEPKFVITDSITAALTEIERARGFLEAAALSETWIEAMQKKALLLEAYHTTHIEGTQLTLDQSEQIFSGKRPKNTDPDDVQELINYRDAFQLVTEYLESGDPITQSLIREIHKKLVEKVRGGSAAPGEYRKIQNYVVNSATGKTIYTPPPAFEVERLMSELTTWVGEQKTVHAVLVSGIAQFQLVHIHPFLDGNGRTARLLSTLCLYKAGYDFKRLFTISEYYDRNRPEYYQALQSVRENQLDLTTWLEYFVQGLASQMQEMQRSGESQIKRELNCLEVGLSERQQRLIQLIEEAGSINISELEEALPSVARRTLQRELKAVLEKGLIVVQGDTNQRFYQLKS